MKTTEFNRNEIVEIMKIQGYNIIQANNFIVEGRKNGWDVIINDGDYYGKKMVRASVENHSDAFSCGKANIINAIIEKMEAKGGVRVERLLNAIRELDARVADIFEMVGVAD